MNRSVYVAIVHTFNNSPNEVNNKGETFRYTVAGWGGREAGKLRVERLENRDLIPIKGWRFFTPSPHSNSLCQPSNFSFKSYSVNVPRVKRPGYEAVH